MGPLIPNGYITGDWNFVIAILIGIAFGFILEASGFSASRNLAGVFYGYKPTRYVSTDQVAKRIIQKDPSLELIDVRSAEEYNKFSLPNAINIPLDSLVNANNLDYFGIKGLNAIFFSNDDIYADQAWVITKRLGFGSTYVMKGGLNKWIETIIQPKEPAEEASSEAIKTYEFRKGAQLYFTGAKVETSITKEKVVVQKRKKTAVAAGGC